MRKFIPMLAFTTTLALVPLIQAAPQKRPPLGSQLTGAERICQKLGVIAQMQAEGRDSGIPYLTALETFRQEFKAFPPRSDLERRDNATILASLRVVYNQPTVTPALARQWTEWFCVQESTRDKDRP